MLHIICGAKEGVRLRAARNPVFLEFADEKKNAVSHLFVVDIALCGGRLLGCRALALPVKQRFVDGIILVHGGRGILLVGLVQRHKEHIQLLIRKVFDAFPHSGGLHKIQRHQDLVPGVSAVQIQRAVEAKLHRLIYKVDPFILILQEFDEFPQHDRAVRQGLQVISHLFVVPIDNRRSPHGHIKHLHHAALQRGKMGKVRRRKARQGVYKKAKQTPGI